MPKRQVSSAIPGIETMSSSFEINGDEFNSNERANARQRLSVDQKKEILKIVETTLTGQALSNSSNDALPDDNDKMSLDQRREILRLIEQGIEATGDDVTESSFQRPALPKGVSISRAQKNEILLLVGQSLEALVEEGNKSKRRHYTKEQKEEMLALTNSCIEEGMSGNAAIKYLNTIPGYEKITRKMIREWRANRSPQQRGRKVSQEFESEVIAELYSSKGFDITSPECDIKAVPFEDVRRCALAVRDRYYEGIGQKWLANPKTKDLHFSSNWVRKLISRNSPKAPKDDMDIALDTDSDED